jgi:hypothetical protein
MRESIQNGTKTPVILGIGINNDHYQFTAKLFRGQRWREAYKELHIPREDTHTQTFMEKITAEDSLYIPIFCIPKEFVKHHPQGMAPNKETITYHEFSYLLNHPDQAARVFFLFGGADYLSDDFFTETTTKPPFKTENQRNQTYMQQFQRLLEFIQGK